jgi:hypothetical protein
MNTSRIEEAILSVVGARWKKVAMVIGGAGKYEKLAFPVCRQTVEARKRSLVSQYFSNW